MRQELLEIEMARCEQLEKDIEEQCRLLGKSGEREADLIGKIERINKENERMKERIRRLVEAGDMLIQILGNIVYLDTKDKTAIKRWGKVKREK